MKDDVVVDDNSIGIQSPSQWSFRMLQNAVPKSEGSCSGCGRESARRFAHVAYEGGANWQIYLAHETPVPNDLMTRL